MEHRRINFLPEEEVTEAIEPPRKRSWLFLFLGVFIFCLLGLGTAFAFTLSTAPNEPEAYDPVTLEPKQPRGLFKRITNFVFSKDISLEGQKDDRINILLLGMGGEGHDGPYLTDTIIIASVKPSTGQVSMVSIPRDLGVDLPGYGWRKINHANAFGEKDYPGKGAAVATRVIEKVFDTPIQYYVRVDFAAFEQIINDVGGISVDVERSFSDSQYPAPNYLYKTVSFTKGVNKMDGTAALEYARSRHGNNGEGSDFARARRQQKMLLALKEKVLSFSTLSNPVRIHNMYSTLSSHLSTNMEFADILALLKLGKNISFNEITTVVLDTSPEGYLVNSQSDGGAFMLSPKSGSFAEINNMIKNVFETKTGTVLISATSTPPQDAPLLTPSIVEVQNGTWRAGLGARVGKSLQNKGISVTTIGNTNERPLLASGIYKIRDTASLDMMQALQEKLGISIKQTPPSTVTTKPDTDILVILGEDYQE